MKPMIYFLLVIAVIAILFLVSCRINNARVIDVLDGDTIEISYKTLSRENKTERVRLIGIDAPELPAQPFSYESTKYLKHLIFGKTVDIKTYGRGYYGRILGTIYLNGKDINLEMITAGMAEVYRGPSARYRYFSHYLKAENYAIDNNLGIWQLGNAYMSPYDWRHMNN